MTRARGRGSICALAVAGCLPVYTPDPTPHAVDYGEACPDSDCAPEIPMTGRVSPVFRELDVAVRQFMKFRCVGAAAVSVSLRGRRIYKRGFGKMAGPPAPDLPGCNDGAMAGLDPYRPEAAFVQPDTPFASGSVAKFVTAAMVRELVERRIEERGLQDMYPTASHALVFDRALDLVPPALLDAVWGVSCGGVTVAPEEECTRACGDAGPDVRVRAWTIGDLLAHTAGLARSNASVWEDWVVADLGAVRGYSQEDEWAAEDAALRARYPHFAAGMDATRRSLRERLAPPGPIYFVSRYDARTSDPIEEFLSVILTRCLERDPEGATDDAYTKGHYSNTGPSFLDLVVAHLGAGGRYAAEAGHPEQHDGSQLQVFLEELGIDGGVVSREGIFHRPKAHGVPGFELFAEPRAWSASARSYWWTRADEKRPFCVWQDGACDFTPWLEHDDLRPAWDFSGTQAVGMWAFEFGLGVGTGALGFEAPALLRIVNKYALGQNDIVQGRRRDNCGPECATPMGKGGGHSGTSCKAISLPGGPEKLVMPAPDASGRVAEHGERGHIPVDDYPGLDFVAVIAQSDDGKAGGSTEYRDLDEFVRWGLSRVDWAQVERELDLQRRQVVGMAAAGGDTIYWFADDHYEVRRGPPRGPDTGEPVTSGTYTLPATRIGPDVLAVALDGEQVIAWYDDGHVSFGTVERPGETATTVEYLPAAGQTYREIAGVTVTPEGAIAVYRDGTLSRGTPTALAESGVGELALPSGHDPQDIRAIASDPAGDLVALLADGSVVTVFEE